MPHVRRVFGPLLLPQCFAYLQRRSFLSGFGTGEQQGIASNHSRVFHDRHYPVHVISDRSNGEDTSGKGSKV